MPSGDIHVTLKLEESISSIQGLSPWDDYNHDREGHSWMNFPFNLDLALELFPLPYFSFRLKLDLSYAQVSLEDNHAQSPW